MNYWKDNPSDEFLGGTSMRMRRTSGPGSRLYKRRDTSQNSISGVLSPDIRITTAMKFLLLVCLGSLTLAQEQTTPQGPGPFVRSLDADVLRDFPGFCFSSTNFNLYLPASNWSLFPFCGIAECVEEGGKLVERVRDCGPQPKANEKCQISNLAELQRNDTILPYPQCCPVYQCTEGVTLEYPTAEEVQAEIQKQKAAALQAARETAIARDAAEKAASAGAGEA